MNRGQGKLIALCVGGAGLAGAAAGWILTPAAFPHAWLAAVAAWIEWPIGCMGLLLIHALTGGSWGYATRTQLVAGMSTLLLLPLALIPLMAVAPRLYSWSRPDVATHLANSFYLNPPAAIARTIFYLIVWFGLAWSILRALRLDEHDSTLERIAPVGLILLAITVTFAAIDATMSLDPKFSSSVYGLIAIAEMGLLALAVSIFGVAVVGSSDRQALNDLGRLLLALLILWAYLDFVQLLIVWQSDLPNEALWYGVRLKGGWGIAAAVVAGLHFALPFFALLAPGVRQSPIAMASVTVLLILAEIIRGWWLVAPQSPTSFGFVDVSAMVGVIGVAAALALHAPLISWTPTLARRDV